MINAEVIAQKVLSIVEQMHELHRPRIVPSKCALVRVIEDVFWSSVDQYEGNPLRARIYFAPKEAMDNAAIVRLSSPRQVSQDTIHQLSPAHSVDGALLAVEDLSGEINIEGILCSYLSPRGGSPIWLSIECRGPGSLRVCIGSEPILEFAHGTLKHLGGMSFDRNIAAFLLSRQVLGPTEPPRHASDVSWTLLDIGMALERDGIGGALWILPSGASMDGDLEKLGHRVDMKSDWWEPFREAWEDRTSLIRLLNPGCNQGHEFLQEAAQQWDFLRQDAIARTLTGLTKVDGAIVMTGSPQVLAFGVICNRFRYPATEVLQSTDPSRPYIGKVVDPAGFGGSRHRSAIDFCSSHCPAGALVASHDGGLTVFASLERGRVIGSRVSLLSTRPLA